MVDYPTPNHHPGRVRPVRLIVLHSTETPAATARAVATGFQDPARRASSHYVVGTDGVVSCVAESDTAWAAPGANADGVQIEQCGYAGSTDWTSGDGAAVVAATAGLVAGICARHSIPLRALTDGELAAGQAGIVTHAQVSRVYRRSDHWDPGPSYPMATLLAIAAGHPTTTTATDPDTQEDLMLISTTTPWGATAHALITTTSAHALGEQEAAAYTAATGQPRHLPWDWYQLLIRQAWERRASLLADMGRTMTETVDAAVARVIDATKTGEAA